MVTDYTYLIGQKFKHLTVLGIGSLDDNKKHGQRTVMCLCCCGNQKVIKAMELVKGRITSCGCRRLKIIGEASKTHGMSKTALFIKWRNILLRCYNPKDSGFHRYGGRGIGVCEEWRNNFLSFYNWAISTDYDSSLSLDRIEGKGDYSPVNCRWATRSEQAINRKTTLSIRFRGVEACMKEWADYFRTNYKVLHSRIKYKKENVEEVFEELYEKKKINGKAPPILFDALPL